MIATLTDHPATKRIAIASIALVLFAGIVAAATQSSISIGEGRLTAHGRAAVIGLDGHRREVSGVVALHTGDTVEAIDGAMTVELPDGSTIEGRPGFKTSGPTRVKIDRPVELLGGELLVVARSGTELMASGTRVRLDRGTDDASAMRVSRSLAVDATAYRGTVSLDSAGQARSIPALRTLDVSALGRPASTATALKIDAGDPWDRRYLSAAIDLDNALEPYATGSTRSLGTANSASPEYYRTSLPSLANEPGLTADLVASTPHATGDMIIGAAIAGLSRKGDFTSRWDAVFAFHDQGATWGLVALDQGVKSGPLLNEVQSGLNTTPFAFAQGAPRTTRPTTTGPTSTTGTTTTAPTGAGPTTQPPPPTSPTVPPPTVPPPTIPTPTVPTLPPPTLPVPNAPQTGDPVVDGLVNGVNQLVGSVVGQPPNG